MARVPITLRVAVASLLFLTTSAGAVLAPKKASDLRTVSTDPMSSTCPGLSSAYYLVGDLHNSDGTIAAPIPAGSVFVITDFEWRLAGAPPSAAVGAVLVIGDGSGGQSLAAFDSANAAAGGAAQGHVTLPGGVAVKGGGPSLCGTFSGTSWAMVVTGSWRRTTSR